jgi:hypothetical protein
MAKVYIVKWSQKLIFVDGTPFFGPTPDFEIALKSAIFQNIWVCQKWHFRKQKSISETTLQYILLPYNYCKVVSDYPKIHQKVHFLRYFNFRPVFHYFPYCNAKNLPPPEGKELQRAHGGFWKWHDQGNNLGGCRSYKNEKCGVSIALLTDTE